MSVGRGEAVWPLLHWSDVNELPAIRDNQLWESWTAVGRVAASTRLALSPGTRHRVEDPATREQRWSATWALKNDRFRRRRLQLAIVVMLSRASSAPSRGRPHQQGTQRLQPADWQPAEHPTCAAISRTLAPAPAAVASDCALCATVRTKPGPLSAEAVLVAWLAHADGGRPSHAFDVTQSLLTRQRGLRGFLGP
jgi:hypothetical protein